MERSSHGNDGADDAFFILSDKNVRVVGSDGDDPLSLFQRGEGAHQMQSPQEPPTTTAPPQTTFPEHRPPAAFPFGRVAVIGCVLFANEFASLIVFPILPFMVHDFLPTVPKSQLGTYVGILGTAFYIGNLSGSIFWGHAADKYGRRPILILGLCGTLLTSLLFGFSTTFVFAVFARALWGLLNGNIGVAKAYLSEICTEKTQARAFSVIGIAASLGRLTGPAVGAFLAHPTESMPHVFGGSAFFQSYPYALPCLIGVVMCAFIIYLSYKRLQETVADPQPLPIWNRIMPKFVPAEGHLKAKSSDIELCSALPAHVDENALPETGMGFNNETGNTEELEMEIGGCSPYTATFGEDDPLVINIATATTECKTGKPERQQQQTEKHQHQHQHQHQAHSHGTDLIYLKQSDDVNTQDLIIASPAAITTANDDVSVDATVRSIHDDPESSPLLGATPASLRSKPRTILQLASDRLVGRATLLYGMIALIAVITQEIVPLYWLTTPDLNGLNLNMQDIGILLVWSGPLQSITQIFVFPWLSKKYGYKQLYQYSMLVYCLLVVVLIPEVHRISPPRSDVDSALLLLGGANDEPLYGSRSHHHHHHHHVLHHIAAAQHHHMHHSQHHDSLLAPPEGAPGNGTGDGGVAYLAQQQQQQEEAYEFMGVDAYLIPDRYYLVVPCALFALLVSVGQLSFTSTFILISNSCHTHERGVSNGLGQTYASFARVTGPLIGGVLFAWSERNTLPWPLDVHLVWYLVGIACLVALYIASLLPNSINARISNHH